MVYGRASVLSCAKHILGSGGGIEASCNYHQINMNFHHGLFFILVGNDLIALKTSCILPWRPAGYLDVARMHHLPDSLSFFSATMPTPCAVKPFGHCPGYPSAGKSLSSHVAYIPSRNALSLY